MIVRTLNYLCFVCILLMCSSCSTTRIHTETNHKAIAERYFTAIYKCQLSVIDELAGRDIVISYPIFQTLYQTPAIRGRQAVKRFASSFCSKWADAQFTIDEAVEEGNRVAIVWSFQARNVGAIRPAAQPDNQLHTWGGISLLRFNSAGQVVEEIGEESDPGPAARLKADAATK
jgi:ketosteroid isomerase-like protein